MFSNLSEKLPEMVFKRPNNRQKAIFLSATLLTIWDLVLTNQTFFVAVV